MPHLGPVEGALLHLLRVREQGGQPVARHIDREVQADEEVRHVELLVRPDDAGERGVVDLVQVDVPRFVGVILGRSQLEEYRVGGVVEVLQGPAFERVFRLDRGFVAAHVRAKRLVRAQKGGELGMPPDAMHEEHVRGPRRDRRLLGLRLLCCGCHGVPPDP